MKEGGKYKLKCKVSPVIEPDFYQDFYYSALNVIEVLFSDSFSKHFGNRYYQSVLI